MISRRFWSRKHLKILPRKKSKIRFFRGPYRKVGFPVLSGVKISSVFLIRIFCWSRWYFSFLHPTSISRSGVLYAIPTYRVCLLFCQSASSKLCHNNIYLSQDKPVVTLLNNFRMSDWGDSVAFCSTIGSLLVGLTGIFPLLFVKRNNKYAGKRCINHSWS